MYLPDAGERTMMNFIQYLTFKIDSAWRRCPEAERAEGRAEFAHALEHSPGITTFAYSTLGFKNDSDLLLWRMAESPECAQESLHALLQTPLGHHCELTHSFIGLIRPSTYVRRPTSQEQALFEQDRQRYLIVYPFVKTAEWYMLSKEERQTMMNDHMRIGHEYPMVRQLLAYSTGLDDQEFIVAYETNDLDAFQTLVIALRATKARLYTLRDTPIFTAVYRPLAETLALLG